MQPTKTSIWKQWFKPSRLIPVLTILAAGITIVLSLLNVFKLSIAENIIIALLALLAVDALSERLNILERVDAKLSNLAMMQTLRKRRDIPTITNHAQHASEINLLAIHAVSAVAPYIGFYEDKLKEGCTIRIILLDPHSPSLQTLNLQTKTVITKHQIESSLSLLKGLVEQSGKKGKCEVRLLNVFLPFSIFGVDLHKESGSMAVEFRSYKVSLDERPHIYLTKAENPEWFNYYKKQFEQAWSDSVLWKP